MGFCPGRGGSRGAVPRRWLQAQARALPARACSRAPRPGSAPQSLRPSGVWRESNSVDRATRKLRRGLASIPLLYDSLSGLNCHNVQELYNKLCTIVEYFPIMVTDMFPISNLNIQTMISSKTTI